MTDAPPTLGLVPQLNRPVKPSDQRGAGRPRGLRIFVPPHEEGNTRG